MGKGQSIEDVLKDMRQEFVEKKGMVLQAIGKNDDKIAEIDRYLISLLKKEDIDFKVFSPRNIESIYKDKIEKEKIVKKDIEYSNQSLYKKVGFYSDKIEKLDYVLLKLKNSNNGSFCESKTEDVMDTFSVIEMQEKERQRIARDLHDSIVQNLVHMIHKVELCSKFMDQDIVRAKLELYSVNTTIKESIEELRNTIFNLRPMDIDDLGFSFLMERLESDLKGRAKNSLAVKFEIDDVSDTNDVIVMSIYRMIQECCFNVIKHADANLLTVKVKNETNRIRLQIDDDGIGFDTAILKKAKKNNFGLDMTRERIEMLSGKIEIKSKCTEGTSILIEIPKV